MRRLRRWARIKYAEYRIIKRLNEIRNELSPLLDREIYFERTGGRGQDSIYFILDNERKIWVMRLLNPWKTIKVIDPSMPYTLLPAQERLLREWNAYNIASTHNLTPHPVWRTDDAIVCEYVPMNTMHSYLLSKVDDFWPLLIRASLGLDKLHKTGLTHMDASLANILSDENMNDTVFIDFEFAPTRTLSVSQQRAYDFLRLLESSIKFARRDTIIKSAEWVLLLKELTADFAEDTDIKPLLPALPRILAMTSTRKIMKELFGYC